MGEQASAYLSALSILISARALGDSCQGVCQGYNYNLLCLQPNTMWGLAYCSAWLSKPTLYKRRQDAWQS